MVGSRLVTIAGFLFMMGCATAEPVKEPAVEESKVTNAPVQVMVLGVYHFSNPGQDLNNFDAEDVLSDRRQNELTILVDALAKFEPTVLAVEASAAAPYKDQDWPKFLAGELPESRNEIEQIGYRLAKTANVDRVYAIDEQPSEGEPDYFPYEGVAKSAEATGRSDELKSMSDASSLMAGLAAAEEKSIPHALLFMNTNTDFDSFYWDIIGFGEGEDQPGAELASYWFLRNAKIFNKLQQVTQPGDRVVVVYGAGHRYWLEKLVENTTDYDLEPVSPYLKDAIAGVEASSQ